MNPLAHLALNPAGIVVAHFLDAVECSAFCVAHGYTHLPFNPNNRDRAPVPAVGTAYVA